jgi:hypothetical protein
LIFFDSSCRCCQGPTEWCNPPPKKTAAVVDGESRQNVNTTFRTDAKNRQSSATIFWDRAFFLADTVYPVYFSPQKKTYLKCKFFDFFWIFIYFNL